MRNGSSLAGYLPRPGGARVAADHRLRPQEHAVVVPQRRVLAGDQLDADGCGDQGRAAAHSKESGGPARGGAGERRVARVL